MRLSRPLTIGVAAGAAGVLAVGVLMNDQEDGSPEQQSEEAGSPSPSLSPAAQPQPETPNNSPSFEAAESDSLEFNAVLPEEPQLAAVTAQLQTETQTYYDRVQREADQAAQSSSEPMWEFNVVWRPVASAGGYVSLIGRSSEYRGGAHPIELIDTKLMRSENGDEVPLGDLFAAEWPTPAVTIAICEALKTAKTDKIGAPTVFDEPIVCAGPNSNLSAKEAKFVPAASTETNRFGGLHVFYQPYLVGAYSEGSYELTVPYEVFREDLTKEHQPLFSGSPVPLAP